MVEMPSRRAALLYLVGSAFGAMATTVAFSFVRSKSQVDPLTERFLTDAGSNRLLYRADAILPIYCKAPLGTLSFWYQNFWELNETYGALEKFAAECASSPIQERAQREGYELQRLKVLPAVARLHALAGGAPEVTERQSSEIRRIHQEALDSASPEASREVLETIWQNATASLISNEISWGLTEFDDSIVTEARRVLLTFLDDDPYLLMPAVAAWQFLLTYRSALRSRSTPSRSDAVQSTIAEVSNHPMGRESYWLRTLQSLTDKRTTLASSLPQMNEVLMFRRRADFGLQDAVDFFTLVRMEQSNMRMQAFAGQRRTPYLWPSRKIGRTNVFLRQCGLTAGDVKFWRGAGFGKDPRLGPTHESTRYWESLLSKPLAESEALVYAPAGSPGASALAKILPFNRVDSNRVARSGYNRKLSLEQFSDSLVKDVAEKGTEGLLTRMVSNVAEAFSVVFPVLKRMEPARATEDTLRSLEQDNQVTRSFSDIKLRVQELGEHRKSSLGVALPPSMRKGVGGSPPAKEENVSKRARAWDDPDIQRLGLSWYEKLRPQLIAKHHGEVVVINVDSGAYVTGKSSAAAIVEYEKAYPDTDAIIVEVATRSRVSA